MARRKVTFVYDPAKPAGFGDGGDALPEAVMRGAWRVDPSSVTVEDLPDPPIVEEFVVRLTSPAGRALRNDRLVGAHVRLRYLIQAGLGAEEDFGRTVEVTDA